MSSCAVAIIGGGPKGMYGLERLVAEFNTLQTSKTLEIHIYNRGPHFGSGDVYRPDQPDFLKMNISTSQIDMWWKELPESVVPNHLNFEEWLTEKNLTTDDFPPRALVGEYLEWGFEQIEKNLPANIQLKKIKGEVIDIHSSEEGYSLLLDGKTENTQTYKHVLLATGHPRETDVHRFYTKEETKTSASSFIPFIYPVETKLKKIEAGSTVALQGMGLTFVDAVLALTEGRDGEFKTENERLVYKPSGKEPSKIYPFSRSGMPMIPRTVDVQDSKPQLQFFTSEATKNLEGDQFGKLDFKTQVWPLIQQDMTLAYYKVLFKNKGFEVNSEELKTFEELQKAVKKFHQKHPESPVLNIKELISPLIHRKINSSEETHEFITEYLNNLNEQLIAKAGENPLVALSKVWACACDLFGVIYKFGGLTPESQKEFDSDFASTLCRITYGPPVKSMQKIVALAQAGILDFGCGPAESVRYKSEIEKYVITPKYHKTSIETDFLVDARIPKFSLQNNGHSLYNNLLKKKLIRPYTNHSPYSATTYSPGGLDLTSKGFVKNSLTNTSATLAATGTPTEGITYDNDALTPYRNNLVSSWASQIKNII